jgi:hypothetical protein
MMKAHVPQRRTALRGALATGCTLVLWGCKAKQEESSTGTPASPSSKSKTPPGPAESRKASQAQAQYQGQPKGDQKCGKCVNFVAGSNTCKVVEGQVSPNGWCMFWVKAG